MENKEVSKNYILSAELKGRIIDALGTATHNKPFAYIHAMIEALAQTKELQNEPIAELKDNT
jgi:hypothetical protein